MNWYFVFILASFAALLLLLWQANLPRQLRHRQAWSPLAALLLVVGVVLLVLEVYAPASQAWAELVAEAAALLGLRPATAFPDFPVVANLLLLAGFGVTKLLVNLPLRLRRDWRSRLGLGPAYQHLPEQGVVLRTEWVFPGVLFRYAGFLVAGTLLLLGLIDAFLLRLPFALSMLPVLALLLLLETGWYLGGELPADRPGEISGAPVRTSRVGDYAALWEEYQQLWPQHLLAATDHVPWLSAQEVRSTGYRRVEEGDEAQQAVTRAWHELLAAGHPLGDIHYQILDGLWRGRDVLVGDAVYSSVSPVLFAALRNHLVHGHTVLVLLPAALRHDDEACRAVEAWLRQGLARAEDDGGTWTIGCHDPARERGAPPHLWMAAAAELLAANVLREAWLARLRSVVVVDGGRTLAAAPLATAALMRGLRRLRPELQQVILSADRRALESAVRDTLVAQVDEYRTQRAAPADSYAICWRLEASPWFQQRVMVGPADRYLGDAPVLALLAWRDGVRPIHLVNQQDVAWAEHLEELDKHLTGLREPVPRSRLAGSAREVLESPRLPELLTPRPRAFQVAQDRFCNLTEVLRAWLPQGTDSAFVHVVSPSYLLRDYLADNAAYFVQAPLLPLSPRLTEGRLIVAYTLFERLIAAELTEAAVLMALRAVEPDARQVEDSLVPLFRETLQVDLREHHLLTVRTEPRFDEASGEFEAVTVFRLSPEIRKLQVLSWLQRYRILDRGDRVRGEVTLDHLHQSYLPGQVHAFQGKPFRIERVDHASCVVRIDHDSSGAPPVLYRQVREVTLTAARSSVNLAHRREYQEAGWHVEVALWKGDFQVTTEGYYSFAAAIDLTATGSRLTALPRERVPERSYREHHFLRLELTPPTALEPADRERIADTLALLVGEALPTLYPETWRFLLVCGTPGSGERTEPPALRALLPRFTLTGDARPEAMVDAGRAPLVLHFFEDSHAPLGLLQSLFHEWRHVLQLLEDYLGWVLEPEDHRADGWRRGAPGAEHFLHFGLENPPSALDLAGTRAFLHGLVGDRNALRVQRHEFFTAPRDGSGGLSAATRQCDFCGDLLHAEFQRLDDGRERCERCTRSAVDDLAELRRVYDDARRFLTGDLGLTLRRDIDVEFASAERIQEAAGRSFVPTAGYDSRAVGMAIQRGNRFVILIEQGFPRFRMLGTIVHELTHIWQYTYLDVQRMRAEHGLLLIEGLAQWAELACLERQGLERDYHEREISRADVYGHGYRLILEMHRRDGHLYRNPFEMLLSQFRAERRL